MKKILAMLLLAAMMLALAACGSTAPAENTSSAENTTTTEEDSSAKEDAAPAEEATPAEAAAPAEETAPSDVTEIDVGGPYPATTDWDEYVVVPYYFAATDQTVDMLIETNSAHDKFNTLFDFFGDKQEMSFSVNGGELSVDYDLTGFIGKDVEAIYAFITENVTEWKAISADASAAEIVEIDVGGPYPATTDWDEYALVQYYFAETDQDVDMLIETNSAHDKFNTLFDFFGDKQEMSFSVNNGELSVDYDLTGFIGKDVEAIYAFITENVTEWSTIG